MMRDMRDMAVAETVKQRVKYEDEDHGMMQQVGYRGG